jgi:hypothetical protein
MKAVIRFIGPYLEVVIILIFLLALGAFIWFSLNNQQDRIARYLNEHECSIVSRTKTRTIYRCDHGTWTDDDIKKLINV